MCDSPDSVVFGLAQRQHDGWGHSYSAGYCYRYGAGPGHPGPKTIVAISTLAGDVAVFGNDAGSELEKFPDIYDASGGNGPVIEF
jgi:hypothetical protein